MIRAVRAFLASVGFVTVAIFAGAAICIILEQRRNERGRTELAAKQKPTAPTSTNGGWHRVGDTREAPGIT